MPAKKRPQRARRRTYLREWRQYRQMTLVQVAPMIGWDHSSLGRLERGETPYNQDHLELLADIYRCQPTDLLIRNPEVDEPSETELVRQLASAPPELRAQAAAVIEALLKTRR